MDQILEFAGNHLALTGAFVAVILLLTWIELTRRVSGVKQLTPAQAVAFMNQDGTAVLDVSPPAEFKKGHILGARNVQASRLANPDAEIAKLIAKPILVACKTGQTAGNAANSLVKAGAQDVAVLKGGMVQWTSDHYPVTNRK